MRTVHYGFAYSRCMLTPCGMCMHTSGVCEPEATRHGDQHHPCQPSSEALIDVRSAFEDPGTSEVRDGELCDLLLTSPGLAACRRLVNPLPFVEACRWSACQVGNSLYNFERLDVMISLKDVFDKRLNRF